MVENKVDSRLLLITLILILISLLLLNNFMGQNRQDDVWNYKEMVTANDIKYLGTSVTDRQIYYSLENVVNKYINSYNVTNTKEDDIDYKQYYQYLAKNYKKHLSKKEYIEVAEKFFSKFYALGEYAYTYNTLKNVYLFDNGIYLCELNSKTNNDLAFLAIQLNTMSNTYNIVYIE